MQVRFNRWLLLFIPVSILLFSGCAQKATITATPTVAGNPMQYLDKNSETAFQAYPIAKADALKWNDKAVLEEISPTRVMEMNLGQPPGGPGWFFMFRVSDSPVEFYVEIVDGAVYGHSEAQPIVIGKRKFERLPIDISKNLIDSDEALKLCVEGEGKDYFSNNKDTNINYRLVHINGTENPVWSIFDTNNPNKNSICNIDAVTKKNTKDPMAGFE